MSNSGVIEKEKGIIYILTNESMPGYIKIGKTQNLKQRLANIDNTSIPLPFEIHSAFEFENYGSVERTIHSAFDFCRVNPKREFFEIDPDYVACLLREFGMREVKLKTEKLDESDAKKIEEKKRKKDNFSFKMVYIPEGAVLTFTKNPDKKVTTVGEKNMVKMGDDRELSISAAAVELLNEEGYVSKSAQGAAFFEYEGETLKERRERMENLEYK